ncbi:MAG: response regulator [Gemmatimonadaceae bacterium]
MAVDDDSNVLGAIERDLRDKYRADYRIMKAGSGAEGLEASTELAKRNVPVALFLADQRMPGISGTEMLREAMKLYPESRRVLLTAYADTWREDTCKINRRIHHRPGRSSPRVHRGRRGESDLDESD